MNEVDEWITPLGTHSARIDGDRIYVTLRGKMTAEDIRGIFALAAQVRKKHPFAFFLYDARQASTIDPDARKSAPREHDVPADLRVIFGVSFASGVFLNMLIRAQKTLLNRDIRIHIFEREAEAREFFEQECARMRGCHRP